MAFFDLFKRKPTKPTAINVQVALPCVVRPGDTVLIADHAWYSLGVEAVEVAHKVREQLEPLMPPGARLVFWPADPGSAHVNLTRLAQEILGKPFPDTGSEGRCDSGKKPFESNGQTSAQQEGAARQPVDTRVNEPGNRIVGLTGNAPKESFETLPNSHGGGSL